jgi:transposase
VLLRERRDTASAVTCLRQAIERTGVLPEVVVTDRHRPYVRAVAATCPGARHIHTGLHRPVCPALHNFPVSAWVDQGSTGSGEACSEREPGWCVEVVSHPRKARDLWWPEGEPIPHEVWAALRPTGFRGVLPRRWAVERTFSWRGPLGGPSLHVARAGVPTSGLCPYIGALPIMSPSMPWWVLSGGKSPVVSATISQRMCCLRSSGRLLEYSRDIFTVGAT